MTAVVEVRFKGNRKEYFAWGADQPPAVESPVIVEVERGQDLGRVSAVGETAAAPSGLGWKKFVSTGGYTTVERRL